jgi:hypothetical protein
MVTDPRPKRTEYAKFGKWSPRPTAIGYSPEMVIVVRIIVAVASILATVGFLFSGHIFWAALFFLVSLYVATA